jgi:uncharacterized protein YfiM (DUF2279 family)
MKLNKITIITGHYGSGKTNTSANLAMRLAREGQAVSVVDLDIVNPYFRTADFKELFAGANINLIASKYANSGLDIPALTFDVAGIIEGNHYTIIDVGGDDEGAKALGRYAPKLNAVGYEMYYVINKYRFLTRTAEEAAALMREIEAASGLKCTGLINNSNLGANTAQEDIDASLPFANEVAELTGLPLYTLPAEIYVKTIWQ